MVAGDPVGQAACGSIFRRRRMSFKDLLSH
jgi:hypothetical protein